MENTSTRSAAADYRRRFVQVLDYVDAHLEEDLPVERLAALAAFSPWHFHRQFAALFGIGVYRYVQLGRLKRASCELAFRNHRRVLEIALRAGYEGPEAFARAFRRHLGQSPSDFRREPQWAVWREAFRPLHEVHEMRGSMAFTGPVRIVEVAPIRVAVCEHRGDPATLGDSIRRFIAWRREHRLPPGVSATYNIAYDDPQAVPPAAFRMDLCAAIGPKRVVAENAWGIVTKTIPGGRRALVRHIGSEARLGDTLRGLYRDWLPSSGETPGDFPLYWQRLSFYPDVPEPGTTTDVFLPLASPRAARPG